MTGGLPPLPLLLWETPPGLELILRQEGVAFRRLSDPHPLAFAAGRIVLHDGRRITPARARAALTAEHVALDVNTLRDGERTDPFEALVSTASATASWRVEGRELTERVAKEPRGAIRGRLLRRLRQQVTQAGGLWARLAAYPHPYRSAFNLRLDLDEPVPDDYFRFARDRRPLDDCTTHFVSTHAYGHDGAVLDDLGGHDAQSHGHFHVIYRDAGANRLNLERAHALLTGAGLPPSGFAAPHGRWNPGLDRALEDLDYEYSSDFQLGYDDVPFFPWRSRDGRFSRVLQVPIHPVCEGLFLDAGLDPRTVADYLAGVVRAKVAGGEPAFVYGHPERRLGRMPEVVPALAAAIEGDPLVWRVTLTRFARWWRWRDERRWGVMTKDGGGYEIQFEEWDSRYRLALEVVRGDHVAAVPIERPIQGLRLESLAYVRHNGADLPTPTPGRRTRSLRAAVRAALDWETVTPIDELPTGTLSGRLKKRLRRWQVSEVGR